MLALSVCWPLCQASALTHAFPTRFQDTFDWQVQGPGNPNGLATTVVEQNYDALYGLQAQGAFSGHGAIVLSHEINQGTM